MTAAAPRRDLPRRRLILGLALFSAISAIGGGAELLAFPHGNRYVPAELLDPTPFSSFWIPGLLLTFVVGGSSLIAAVATSQRWSKAADAVVIAGAVLSGWIAAEVALLGGIHWLHGLYGGLGLAILGLGILAARHAS